MIEADHADSLSMSPDGKDDGMREIRDRVRAVIRAEIAQFHPTDDARQPLELIVETFLRYGEKDGALAITVVDESGQPRTSIRNGQVVAATIRDLLEELRQTHPALFKPISEADTAAPDIMHAAPTEHQPQRDWLSIGSVNLPSSPDAPSAPLAGSNVLHRLHGDRIRMWVHQCSRTWSDLSASHAPKLRSARDRLRHAFPGMRNAFRGVRTDRQWGKRPLVLGAAALAALLAIGAFALSRNDRVVLANAAEPAATGAIAPVADTGSLRGVPQVIDTATLSLQGRVVRLFGVEWASGAGKPDDLTRYLAGREVACEAVASTNTYRCQVNGQDLSKVVLFNGGGRATAQATDELKAAAEKARQARIGVWNR
ncbi:thermonuclease family protein [Microvirga sp. 2TAF3]|uniref:thermonuclease family protein n=1 Tax=Microvirga sp. 2TAF3 TaxID=3233014 RepID=UPI003F9C29FB